MTESRFGRWTERQKQAFQSAHPLYMEARLLDPTYGHLYDGSGGRTITEREKGEREAQGL